MLSLLYDGEDAPWTVLPLAQPVSFALVTVMPVLAAINLLRGSKLPVLWQADQKTSLACWLVYFVLYIMVKPTFDLLSIYLPFVFELQTLFFVWLYHPEFRGGLLLIDLLFEVTKHNAVRDHVFAFAQKWAIKPKETVKESKFDKSQAEDVVSTITEVVEEKKKPASRASAVPEDEPAFTELPGTTASTSETTRRKNSTTPSDTSATVEQAEE
ncbi:unnamed protein product [Amoebophrya sp. A120]|nr:unnamed protein product [Amoebophrya sp. A120]|eukprot:GSA120T00011675001.1